MKKANFDLTDEISCNRPFVKGKEKTSLRDFDFRRSRFNSKKIKSSKIKKKYSFT